jgi:hypothetical protein
LNSRFFQHFADIFHNINGSRPKVAEKAIVGRCDLVTILGVDEQNIVEMTQIGCCGSLVAVCKCKLRPRSTKFVNAKTLVMPHFQSVGSNYYCLAAAPHL